MPPVLLGIVLGIVNTIANAVMVGIVEPRAAAMVLFFGLVPAIATGAVMGVIAVWTRSLSPIARLLSFAVITGFVVFVLGVAFDFAQLVPYALVPTVLCCVALEKSTREAPTVPIEDPTMVGGPAPRSAVKLSLLIGAIVMLVVMIGVDLTAPHWHGVTEAYIPFGLGIALGLSAPFGMIAERTRPWSVPHRRLVLLAVGFMLTAFLASILQLDNLIVVAFIPVAAGCLALERYSRAPDRVPVAIAR